MFGEFLLGDLAGVVLFLLAASLSVIFLSLAMSLEVGLFVIDKNDFFLYFIIIVIYLQDSQIIDSKWSLKLLFEKVCN